MALLGLVCARGETIPDIEYARVEGESLRLDVHLPEGKGPFPVAILVHGGGWTAGDKSGSNHPGDSADISPWFDLLQSAGFVSFSINYRLAPQFRWPAQVVDLDTAIRWVKAHATEYHGDPARIVLFGHSAGGHLVMYAATQTDPALRVSAVVGFAPVTDLVADSDRRGGLSLSLQKLFNLLKELTPESRQILADASPIEHVHERMPPILIVNGDADRTVPVQMSEAFVAKLHESGDSARLIVRHGAPHSLVAGENADPAYKQAMFDWLNEVLKSPTK